VRSLFRLQPELDQALELSGGGPHEQPAIVKANRDAAIVAALDNLANLPLKRRLSFPSERPGNELYPIADVETAISFALFQVDSLVRLISGEESVSPPRADHPHPQPLY
jgi:hypothetical protein